MNDQDVEAKLARWKPGVPPAELMRRLHATAPAKQLARHPWRRAGEWFATVGWRPRPLAYSGLLAAWILILVLRLTTPSEPASVPAHFGEGDHASDGSPAFARTLAAERMFLLSQNHLDQLSP